MKIFHSHVWLPSSVEPRISASSCYLARVFPQPWSLPGGSSSLRGCYLVACRVGNPTARSFDTTCHCVPGWVSWFTLLLSLLQSWVIWVIWWHPELLLLCHIGLAIFQSPCFDRPTAGTPGSSGQSTLVRQKTKHCDLRRQWNWNVTGTKIFL